MNSKRRLIMAGLAIAIGTVACIYFSALLHLVLNTKSLEYSFPTLGDSIRSSVSVKSHLMLFLCFEGFVLLFAFSLFFSGNKPYQSRIMKITPEISTPVAVGQKQHGSARWMTEKEKTLSFNSVTLKSSDHLIRELKNLGRDDLEGNVVEPIDFSSDFSFLGGVALGIQQKGSDEVITYVGEDTHSLCIGATRSGKTRSVILQSLGLTGLSGESMVLSDPKGELFHYTAPFLQRLGYEVYAIDFKYPAKSHRYNFLQTIINAVDQDDMATAIDATWDLTASLVGEPKGERIWNDGEASSIAAAIMSVIYDNKEGDNRKFRNMTNVYFFIAEMCKTINNTMPIVEYVKRLSDNHPAKGLIAISEIAPSKTRGSFYTAALSTLRLFANNPSIHAMTSDHDLDVTEIGRKKSAVFIILPDEKTTYYSLASLLVTQIYEQLVKVADERGGRLERRVNFFLEEFGNFVKIPGFDNKLTVGGGRGVRFSLFLQSFAQLEEKYGREVARTIRGNCETWIYLQADDQETLDEFSKKLGNYTVSSYSLSSSQGKHSSPSSSESVNLMSRSLLTSDEVGRITRPYSLVTSRSFPAVMYAPDLAKTSFNAMFGLGDKNHNTKVREMREKRRPQRVVEVNDRELWGIWKKYQLLCGYAGKQNPFMPKI